jgi:type IV pilus assembly protein PilE
MTRGFTLIELLVAMAITAILAVIALPGYTKIVQRAQRNDARLALLDVQYAQERRYQQHHAYTDQLTSAVADAGLGLRGSSESGDYLLSIRLTGDGQGYVALARPDPARRQASDRDCASFSVDDTGRTSAANSAGGDSTATCWG